MIYILSVFLLRIYFLVMLGLILVGLSRLIFTKRKGKRLDTLKFIMLSIIWPVPLLSKDGRKLFINVAKDK